MHSVLCKLKDCGHVTFKSKARLWFLKKELSIDTSCDPLRLTVPFQKVIYIFWKLFTFACCVPGLPKYNSLSGSGAGVALPVLGMLIKS